MGLLASARFIPFFETPPIVGAMRLEVQPAGRHSEAAAQARQLSGRLGR